MLVTYEVFSKANSFNRVSNASKQFLRRIHFLTHILAFFFDPSSLFLKKFFNSSTAQKTANFRLFISRHYYYNECF